MKAANLSHKINNLAITPVILAGGHSRRMGHPKGLIDWESKPLLSHIISILSHFFLTPPTVIINDESAYKDIALALHCSVYGDVHPHKGPLSGLESALLHSPREYIYVNSCDTPFVGQDFLSFLCQTLYIHLPKSPQAIIPTINGNKEPLCAIYHKSALDIITVSIKDDKRSVHHVLNKLRTMYVPCEQFERAFININTEKDLIYARQQLKQ